MTPMERNRGWEDAINAYRQYEQQQTSEQARLAQIQAEFKRLVATGAFDTAEGGGTSAGNWSDRALRQENPAETSQRSWQGWKDVGISTIPGGQTYLEYRKGQEYPERTPDYAKSILGDLFSVGALLAPWLKGGQAAGGGARLGLTSPRVMEGAAFERSPGIRGILEGLQQAAGDMVKGAGDAIGRPGKWRSAQEGAEMVPSQTGVGPAGKWTGTGPRYAEARVVDPTAKESMGIDGLRGLLDSAMNEGKSLVQRGAGALSGSRNRVQSTGGAAPSGGALDPAEALNMKNVNGAYWADSILNSPDLSAYARGFTAPVETVTNYAKSKGVSGAAGTAALLWSLLSGGSAE